MKLINTQSFNKKIKKKQIIQAGAICIGTMLITTLSLKTEDAKLLENFNQGLEMGAIKYPLEYNGGKNHYGIRDYNHGASWDYEEYETFFGKIEEYQTTNSVVMEVIQGKYGNGEDRKQGLEANGYDYDEIQSGVNEYYKNSYEESSTLNESIEILEPCLNPPSCSDNYSSALASEYNVCHPYENGIDPYIGSESMSYEAPKGYIYNIDSSPMSYEAAKEYIDSEINKRGGNITYGELERTLVREFGVTGREYYRDYINGR